MCIYIYVYGLVLTLFPLKPVGINWTQHWNVKVMETLRGCLCCFQQLIMSNINYTFVFLFHCMYFLFKSLCRSENIHLHTFFRLLKNPKKLSFILQEGKGTEKKINIPIHDVIEKPCVQVKKAPKVWHHWKWVIFSFTIWNYFSAGVAVKSLS